MFFSMIQNIPVRLPWWLGGKESACQCRRHRFDPWSRKIPHALEQLSLCCTTTELSSRAQEPQLLDLVQPWALAPQQETPPRWEAHALWLESSPCLAQPEESPCSNKDPAQSIITMCVWKLLSRVQLFVTPRTTQSVEFSRPEYWSG